MAKKRKNKSQQANKEPQQQHHQQQPSEEEEEPPGATVATEDGATAAEADEAEADDAEADEADEAEADDPSAGAATGAANGEGQLDSDDNGDGDYDSDGDGNQNGSDESDDDDDDDEEPAFGGGEMTTPLLNYARILSAGLSRQARGSGGGVAGAAPKREGGAGPLQASPSPDNVNGSSNSNSSRGVVGVGVGPFQPPCTCSELATVTVNPEDMGHGGAAAAAASASVSVSANPGGDNGIHPGLGQQQQQMNPPLSQQRDHSLLLSSDLWQQPHLIMACGWASNNSVSLVRVNREGGSGGGISPPVVIVAPATGSLVQAAAAAAGTTTTNRSGTLGGGLPSLGGGGGGATASASLHLRVREPNSSASSSASSPSKGASYSVVDMSFDASGTVLGAVDEGGTCTIWEFKYTTTMQPNSLMFPSSSSGRMDARGVMPPASPPTSSSAATPHAIDAVPPTAAAARPSVVPPPQAATAAPAAAPEASVLAQGSNSMFSNFMSALTGMPPAPTNGVDDRPPAVAASTPVGAAATNSNSNVGGVMAPLRPPTRPADPTLAAPRGWGSGGGGGTSPTLTAHVVQAARINYPTAWGPPTCMALDPSYRRRRDRSVLVGFASGRLLLTKRGTFFQRRNDTVLYQASMGGGGSGGAGGEWSRSAAGGTDSSSTNSSSTGSTSSKATKPSGDATYRGIETVVWRGALVAWADASGIKLLDMESLTRIAHIDRPTGARPSLYPTVRGLKPSLLFDTSQTLLVAWGDCLMEMNVREYVPPAVGDGTPGGSGGGSSSGNDGSAEVKRRRTVECTMAWELDCVACGVVPFDADHVAVLGLIPLPDHSEGVGASGPGAATNDVEVQVISRRNGTVLYCDSLPVIKPSPSSEGAPDSMLAFRLLSTFALPRMEDAEETKNIQYLMENVNDEGVLGIEMEFDVNQPLFPVVETSRGSKKVEFRDPHLKWTIQSSLFDIEDSGYDRKKEGTDEEDHDDVDTNSVDSDDYEWVLRPIETIEAVRPTRAVEFNPKAPAPTMVVCTGSDAVVSLVSTVDDAVANALERHKCALALQRGLRHKRQLRRFDLDGLINRYLEAVLRLSPDEEKENQAKKSAPRSASSLSLRRMQLAVKAMPVLLGDKVGLWERWARELEAIPGSLFVFRKYLPVRGTSIKE